MSDKTIVQRRLRRCVRVFAACLGIAAVGCTEDSPAPAPDVPVVTPRAEDPEYREALKRSVAERTALLGERARALDAYEAAKADDPEGERTKELEAKVAECDAELNGQRERARRMVTGRIWKEFDEKDAADRAARQAAESK